MEGVINKLSRCEWIRRTRCKHVSKLFFLLCKTLLRRATPHREGAKVLGQQYPRDTRRVRSLLDFEELSRSGRKTVEVPSAGLKPVDQSVSWAGGEAFKLCAANLEVLLRPGGGSGPQANILHTCGWVAGPWRAQRSRRGRLLSPWLPGRPSGFRFLEEIREASVVAEL